MTLALFLTAAAVLMLAVVFDRRRRAAQARQRALGRLLDAADGLESRLRAARAEIEAIAGSDDNPVREAMQEMLRQRLWLQQHAGDASLAQLESVRDSIDAARARIDGQLALIERARLAAPLIPPAMQRLILASTSPYRRALLARLRLPFDTVAPAVDETPFAGEPAVALAKRLAEMKAGVVAAGNADAWTIGSDQVVAHDGTTLGKPGGRERAIAQLTAMSGQRVEFHTALVLKRAGGPMLEALDTTRVRFRRLSDGEIARYVDAETPFDCAGSFKSEGLGIALFDAIESQDPTALIGLPLIATARLLREVGFALP